MKNLDKGWVLTCFGTAVGAGILFLPIQAGLSGVWVIIFLTLIIYPMTYISHRGISRIITSCPKETDIVGAVEHDLGHTAGFIVSILYFLSIISICVGYATSLVNIISSFLTNQMHCIEISRSVLTFVVLIVVTIIMLGGEKIMVAVTSIITFPLIILLFALSVYMIPKWNLSVFYQPFIVKDFVKNTLLLLPILIFAMNFSPVCSSLGAFYRRKCDNIEEAIVRSDSIVKWNSLFLLFFVMFFVFSLFFSITPDILLNAKNNNMDALTAIALAHNNKILKYVPPIIAFLAIVSSYFGHFAGTREGLIGIITHVIIRKSPGLEHRRSNLKKIKLFNTVLLFILLWFLAVYNPSILLIIGALAAPIIALYAYLMPIVLMKYVPRLRKYRSKFAFFVFIIGIFTVVGYYVGRII
jgi:serine transporter